MIYTTVAGDTFDLIAYKQYSNSKLATPIIQENIAYADVVIFGGGVKLNIPEVDNVQPSNLPPWKRS